MRPCAFNRSEFSNPREPESDGTDRTVDDGRVKVDGRRRRWLFEQEDNSGRGLTVHLERETSICSLLGEKEVARCALDRRKFPDARISRVEEH